MSNIDEILTERRKHHGDFSQHARITQNLKMMAKCEKTYDSLSAAHRESIEMILHKIGRILAGNPNYRDHWDDIAGYAKLASDRCRTDDGAR